MYVQFLGFDVRDLCSNSTGDTVSHIHAPFLFCDVDMDTTNFTVISSAETLTGRVK